MCRLEVVLGPNLKERIFEKDVGIRHKCIHNLVLTQGDKIEVSDVLRDVTLRVEEYFSTVLFNSSMTISTGLTGNRIRDRGYTDVFCKKSTRRFLRQEDVRLAFSQAERHKVLEGGYSSVILEKTF